MHVDGMIKLCKIRYVLQSDLNKKKMLPRNFQLVHANNLQQVSKPWLWRFGHSIKLPSPASSTIFLRRFDGYSSGTSATQTVRENTSKGALSDNEGNFFLWELKAKGRGMKRATTNQAGFTLAARHAFRLAWFNGESNRMNGMQSPQTRPWHTCPRVHNDTNIHQRERNEEHTLDYCAP